MSSQRPRAHSDSVSNAGMGTPVLHSGTGLRVLERQVLAHSSVFKCPEMQIIVNSPSVRSPTDAPSGASSLPVFGDHDHIAGSVTLDPQNCAADCGQLTITVEGIFEYISPVTATKPGPSQITPGRHRHIFYHDSTITPLYTASEPSYSPRSRPFRPPFANMKRAASAERLSTLHSLSKTRSVEFRSVTHSVHSAPSALPKVFNFNFALPKPEKQGEELPSTFSVSNIISRGVRGRYYAENADVRYCVRAVWEALDGSGTQAKLEAPVLFQPDTNFQSLDGVLIEPETWSETPLSKVDCLPIECAVTLPTPLEFPRSSSIPYYVVFTTTPRSRTRAAEFMLDATIAVSLVRKVTFPKNKPRMLPGLASVTEVPAAPTSSPTRGFFSSQPPSPTTSSRDRSRPHLFKRVVRSAPPILSGFRLPRESNETADPHASLWTEKPLPSLPPWADDGSTGPESDILTDSRTLHTDVSVGFPKRPKGRSSGSRNHPSLRTIESLPDGLYKGCIPLRKEWFPSVHWRGLSIEYCLHVSVIYDSHEFKTQVPLRLY